MPEVLEHLEKWAKDAEPAVRQSAILLLADYPRQADRGLIEGAAADAEAIVRAAAAQAIGFGQFQEQLPLLSKLIDDVDADTARFAAMSLLSFSVDASRAILERNVEHPEFAPLFVNALASRDPKPYLDKLCDIIRANRQPKNCWGGSIPWGVSWEILYRYAQQQPDETLKEAAFAKVWDALEYPASGDEKGPAYYSSSEPRDLYALYVQRGMTNRARAFRAACRKVLTYDIDYYFKMVDQNPAQYQRQ